MKLILISVILAFFAFTTFVYPEEIEQISIPDIKNEILQLQELKDTEDLGAFGLILDEIFFWFSDNINSKKYIVEKTESAMTKDDKVLNSEIAVVLLRDKNGALKKIIYSNKYLAPLETRNIELDFSDASFTSAKMEFITFYDNIEKDIILQFRKGENRPIKNIDNAVYYGEANVILLQREFSGIENKIIQQDFISPEQDKLGSLGKIIASFFKFKEQMKNKDIFIVYSQRIKNAPLQKIRADCFFIASNLSIVVLYNGRLEISAVYKISRLGDLKFESISFVSNGIQIANVKYDPDNFRLKGIKTYLFPYAKTEPVVLK